MPLVAAAFIVIAAASWLFERKVNPGRGVLAFEVFALEALVLTAATALLRRSRWEGATIGIASAAIASLPVLSSLYHVLVGIEAELLVMALVYIVGATSIALPWGVRGQLPVALAAILSYAAALGFGLKAPLSANLGLVGLTFFGAVSVVGAHLLYAYRRDLHRANRDLAVAYDAVKAAGQTKNEFIANLSHELRTPLNTIVGYTDLLLTGDFGALDDEVRAPLERICKSADNLRALINDLIDLALIETGRLTVEIKEVELAPLFDELAAVTEPMLRDRPVRFRFDEPHHIAVRADATRLRQILTNLVGNAAKYTDTGEIELRALKRNGHVLIEVRDTGLGVPKDEIQSIFQPFFRGSRRGNAAGVGLGLSMSARLAELMGGEITVESDVGRGSKFTLHLSAS